MYSDVFSYACLGFLGYSKNNVTLHLGKSYSIFYRLVGYVGFVWYVARGDIYYVFRHVRDYLSPVCMSAEKLIICL